MITVVIADDHKVFREGIVSILQNVPDIQVVGQAAGGQDALDFLRDQKPDVLLMDIAMGDMSGIEATRLIRQRHPGVKVLILSMYSESGYIVKAMEAGAFGYLLKDAGSDDLITAIRTVYAGGTYFSRQASEALLDHLTRGGAHPKEVKGTVPLTKRELEVLKLIAEEYSNPEIAEKLFISIRTVDTHRRNLLEKLGVKNTAGLVKYAIKLGLLEG